MGSFMNDKKQLCGRQSARHPARHAGQLTCAPGNIRAVYRPNSPRLGKVSIVTGGGFGHLPVFLGYVGQGLAAGCAVGNVFSPLLQYGLEVTQHLGSDAGVLFLFGNYYGDTFSFVLASEMADLNGIPNAMVKVCDDVASSESRAERRGVAGIYFACKIAGACADQMKPLEEVRRVSQDVVLNTSTYGVAVSACHLPASNKPTFDVQSDLMEFGMGIHGERA